MYMEVTETLGNTMDATTNKYEIHWTRQLILIKYKISLIVNNLGLILKYGRELLTFQCKALENLNIQIYQQSEFK